MKELPNIIQHKSFPNLSHFFYTVIFQISKLFYFLLRCANSICYKFSFAQSVSYANIFILTVHFVCNCKCLKYSSHQKKCITFFSCASCIWHLSILRACLLQIMIFSILLCFCIQAFLNMWLQRFLLPNKRNLIWQCLWTHQVLWMEICCTHLMSINPLSFLVKYDFYLW